MRPSFYLAGALLAASWANGQSTAVADPVLRSLQPDTLTAGGPSFTLRIRGQGFTPTTRVVWDGAALGTVFEDENSLEASVPASLIARAGAVAIAAIGKNGKPGAALTLTVHPPLTWITPAVLPTAERGQFYAQALGVTGGTRPVHFTLTAGSVPPGLHFDAYNGAIVGYAGAAGVYTLAIQAIDATGATAPHNVTIAVAAELRIITLLTPAFSGQTYTAQFTASGGSPPYSDWLVTAGALPAGLTLDPKTGALAGVVNAASGTAQFTVSMRDSAGKLAAMPMTLAIQTPLSIPANDAATGFAEGDHVDIRLGASGGAAPLTWTHETGVLPPGVTFDAASARLRGTLEQAGNYRATFKVRDRLNAEAGTTVQIQVAPQLAVTGPASSAAVTGAAASVSISATGGVPPYRFRLASGVLPAGLTLGEASGRIDGTPRGEGEAFATIEASDSAGHSATHTIGFTVDPPALPGLIITPLANGQPGQQTRLDLRLERAYPGAVDIVAELSFDGPPDPAILFSTGGRVARLAVPAGQLASATPLYLQTGTTAGTISLQARLDAPGRTAVSEARQNVVIAATPPRIQTISSRRTADGFEISITAFSSDRQFANARFVFDEAIELTLPLHEMTGAWFASDSSRAFGTLLTYKQNFTVRGDASRLRGVAVSLTNSVGASTPASVAF